MSAQGPVWIEPPVGAMDIEAWLRQLGLSDYVDAFRANHITPEILPRLTSEDLTEIGVRSVGHRRLLLDAIEQLEAGRLPSAPQTTAIPEAGERRQVTVLFADIAGFTRLSSEMEAEQVHRLLGAFFEQVDGIVLSLGGRIDKHIGDCVMAVFGAPVAHTDDVLRAARAAVNVHAAMERVSESAGRAISAHVGIATGEVVASRTGSSSFVEYTVTGDTVNLASRLTDVAGPGETVVTSEVVHALGDAFDGVQLPARQIRGFAHPLGLWVLTSVRSGAAVRQMPMVGRRAELNQCLTLIREMLQTGAGANVIVAGEPGIGKTRLLDEIATEAGLLGVAVVRGAVVDFGAGFDHDVISHLAVELDRLAGTPDVPIVSSPSLKALMRQELSPGERSVLAAMTEQERAAARSQALVETATRAGASVPLLILVEDVHWATAQILTVLDQLGRAISRSIRAVLLLTTRPPGAERMPLDGIASTTIELGALRKDEALALVRLHASEAMPGQEELVVRSGGNPLFLEQLIRHSLHKPSGDALPGSIRSIVLARIDQLGQQEKLALQTLAVLGDEPAADARDALLAPYGAVELSTLIRQRFLHRSGDSVRFAHALIREVCYRAMLKPQRISLHRKAASWFKDRDPVLYAQHLLRGEDPAAAGALLDAARHLERVLRLDEALECLTLGLGVATDTSHRYRLSLARGELLLALARPRESIEAFELAESTAPDSISRAEAMLGRAGGLRFVDAIDEALAILDTCAPAFAAAKAHSLLSRLEHLRGNLHFPRGDMTACQAAHTRALDHALRAGSAELEAQALGGMGDAAYAQGLYLSANRHFTACINRARELGLGRIELANRPMQVISLALSGTPGGVLADAELAIGEAVAARQPRAELIARHAAMISLLLAGRATCVARHFEAAQSIVARTGARRFEPENMAFMAEALRQQGEIVEARRLLERGLAICRETGMSYFGAIVLAFLALAASDDASTRRAVLEEGERLAGAGLRHNAWFFGCYAIESAVGARCPTEIAARADFFARAFAQEPLPIVEALVSRARLLARGLDHAPDPALRAKARDCRSRLHELGADYFARGLDGLLDE